MSVREISCQDLHQLLGAGRPVFLLDCRQPWEHALAALPGSQLVPLGELAGRAPELEPPAGALVVCYCHHGVRSLSAVRILAGAGIEAVSLAGGIDAWSRTIDPSVPRY